MRDLGLDIQEALNYSYEDRIKIIQQGIWVEYPQVMKYKKRLYELYTQSKRPRMIGLAIIGPTAIGKTSMVQEFIDEQKKRENASGIPDHRFLFIEAPFSPSVKALFIRILNECNFPDTYGTTEQLFNKVRQGLQDIGVKMLFIDELHNLLTAKSSRILDECRNALKSLSNHLRIPMVLIGTKKAEAVLQGDTQVLNRFPIIHLKPWANNRDFRMLLHVFESRLPLKKASNLRFKPLAEKLHEITWGVLGNIADLIQVCAIEAINNGIEKITIKIIKDLQNEDRFNHFKRPEA